MPEDRTWTLEDIEKNLLIHIGHTSSTKTEELLRCLEVLTQVKQAQALEKIAMKLGTLAINLSEFPKLDTIAEKLSRIGSILLDK